MLSENIKQLRLEKGLTQSQLAERLHVVRQTVSKWENGSSVPDALLLQKLAEVLDTSPDALLDCAAPPPPTSHPLSKGWLCFTVFWALFLVFAPVEQDWFDSWESNMNHTLRITILILSQMRHYIAAPLLGAGIVFTLRSVVQLPFTLPNFVRLGFQLIGNIMVAFGIIIGFRLTLLPFIGINHSGIDYFWLQEHPWCIPLWMIAAALLICLSTKNPVPSPILPASSTPTSLFHLSSKEKST